MLLTSWDSKDIIYVSLKGVMYSEVLPESGMSEFEFALLWNLNPSDYQEAIALIPSLEQGYSRETVI